MICKLYDDKTYFLTLYRTTSLCNCFKSSLVTATTDSSVILGISMVTILKDIITSQNIKS